MGRGSEIAGIACVQILEQEKKPEVVLGKREHSDEDRFTITVQEHFQMVYSVAWRIIGNAEDAKDIAQETFLKLHRKFNRFSRKKEMRPWLYRIAVNAAIDHLRKRERKKEIEFNPEIHGPLLAIHGKQELNDRETDQIIMNAAQLLPPKQKAVFVLRDIEGLRFGEIAKTLKCSQNAVRSHLSHARAALRKIISRSYPELLTGFNRKQQP